MTKCPEKLPKRTDPSVAGGLLNYVDAANIYHDCKANHNGLVDWMKADVTWEMVKEKSRQ